MNGQINRTGPGRLKQRIRRLKALDLRITGMTYEAIAVELGYKDGSSAYRAVTGILDRVEAESADKARKLEARRLDKYQRVVDDRLEVEAERLKAVKTGVQVSERRSKLLGLDKQREESEATVPITLTLIASGQDVQVIDKTGDKVQDVVKPEPSESGDSVK